MIMKRMVRVWRAVVGSGLTQVETHHAEEMLDLEREELVQRVAEYNRGLAGYAGLAEQLKASIKRLEQEREQRQAKLGPALEQGQREQAGKHALRIEAITEELKSLHTQLSETEVTYRELTRSREVALVAAKERIESLKRSIGDYKVQKALADLTELAAGMHGTLGGTDGTLERVKERVDEKRNFAAGRARVAKDSMDFSGVQQRELEHSAMAEAALQRWQVARGAGLSPTAAATGSDQVAASLG